MHSGFKLIFALFLLLASVSCSTLHGQNYTDSMSDAKILYDEAIEQKAAGNIEVAVEAFEKAVRKDRSILANDDHGLIEELRKKFESGLKENPDDLKMHEGMGFVLAVCYADLAGAISHYERVLELSADESVKERTGRLIDRLRVMHDMSVQGKQDISSQVREERLRAWAQMEKQDSAARAAEDSQRLADRLSDLYRSRDELEVRIPQLEEQLQELHEEHDRARRLWFSLNDELYDRRRRRLKKQVSEKEEELGKLKSTFDAAVKEVEKLESTAPPDSQVGPAAAGGAGASGEYYQVGVGDGKESDPDSQDLYDPDDAEPVDGQGDEDDQSTPDLNDPDLEEVLQEMDL